jgi:chloramphenicol-sensitive protein RarD
VYALLIAASWTTYGYLKRRIPLSPIEGLTIETMVITVPALALIGWHLQYADSVVRTAGAVDWLLIAFLGVITAIPLMMFAYAAQRIPMTVIGPMQYSVPVINFLLGWLAYDETLTPSRVVGFSLVWIALVALTIDTVRRARRPIATNEELY